MMQKYCKTDDQGSMLLKNAMNKLGLSARAYDRKLKVSRTIADMESSKDIRPHHLLKQSNTEAWTGIPG